MGVPHTFVTSWGGLLPTMLRREDESEAEVTLSDQKQINQFGRLSQTIQEVVAEIKSKEEELAALADASGDIMMLEDDDELVPVLIGEVFVKMSQEDAGAHVEALEEKAKQDMGVLESRLGDIKKTMKGLKVELYAKFGKSINLESEDFE